MNCDEVSTLKAHSTPFCRTAFGAERVIAMEGSGDAIRLSQCLKESRDLAAYKLASIDSRSRDVAISEGNFVSCGRVGES